jgi:hypothetical protein
MPAKNEYEIVYRNLKPTTDANIITGGGVNPNAVPPTLDYTTTDPAQTTATLFQSGGGQDFDTSPQYWTATSAIGYRSAYWKRFSDGWSAGTSQNDPKYARAIRREFAYDTGILDIAQETFPNGLWWIKDRENSNQHQFVDSVRSGNLAITTPDGLTESAYSAPAGSSVAWCWNLLPDRSNGFDIVNYVGDDTNTRNIPHNLGAQPEFIIVKNRDFAGFTFFVVRHKDQGGNCLHLNTSSEINTGVFGFVSGFNSTNFTVQVGSTNFRDVNNQGQNYIAYLWRSIPGYSSFGSYVGNGSFDGPFLYTGFRPSFLLYKRTDASQPWYIIDSSRDTYNPVESLLSPNLSQQEDPEIIADFVSNGVKLRNTFPTSNPSGGSFIYMAFAEHPFGGNNVYPANAR